MGFFLMWLNYHALCLPEVLKKQNTFKGQNNLLNIAIKDSKTDLIMKFPVTRLM